MKRDILLLSLCLCILAGVNLLGGERTVPAAVEFAVPEKRILILDAGHGGEDGGASSAAGEKESDINLAIVCKAQALAVFLGVETRLTRNADVSLHSDGAQTIRQKKVSDLKNRVAMVEGTGNAVLLSVHQNHFTDPRYSGAQVFFQEDDLSQQWGKGTQEVLRKILPPGNDREAKPMPDGIYLFDHVSCPAILVECGFLSNGEEAALLRTDAYQRKLAVALMGAYFANLQMTGASREGT